MRTYFFISILIATIVTPCWAQSDATTPRIQWGISAGLNDYKEPDLMQLQGPEAGLHLRTTGWTELPATQLEVDALLGKQKYTSVNSGSLSGVTNLETRWRGLVPLFSDTHTQTGWFAGLAVHTLWNDLRGTTTFQGNTYGGYQRSAMQLWLPVRWRSSDLWNIDAGLLIYGRHTSKLSEVNRNYQDIVNTQRRGQYVQVAVDLNLDNRDTLKPFVRYTHLADSNTVEMGGKYWLEPESNRWQIGAVWEFFAP